MLFKSYSLIIDETYPEISLLKRIAEKGVARLHLNDFSYQYNIQFREERFLFIAVDFDNGKYSETVYDTESETQKENPKKKPNWSMQISSLLAMMPRQKSFIYLTLIEKLQLSYCLQNSLIPN